jgi:hypothetical protein
MFEEASVTVVEVLKLDDVGVIDVNAGQEVRVDGPVQTDDD